MAPTPENPKGYTALSAPYVSLRDVKRTSQRPTSSARYGWLRGAAQVCFLGCCALYVFGQLVFFTPVYRNAIAGAIGEWWGVPPNQPRGAPTKGHPEMVVPTFFLLFAMLPLLVSALLFEFLRGSHLRRISSQHLLQISLLLRLKPKLLGNISYWCYGEWLFLLGLAGGNVFVFERCYSARMARLEPLPGQNLPFEIYLQSVAISMGFVCLFNLAFMFLPATRNGAWAEFFNISYANGIKYHRWIGILTVLSCVFHCAGFYWSWIRKGTWKEHALPCFDCDLTEHKAMKAWMNVFGEIALFSFLLISLTSIPVVRRKFYNLFYYAHQLFYVAVPFAIMHWGNIVWWVLPPFVLYCYSRAVSMSSNFAPIQVKELTAIDDDIVKVVIKRSPGRDGHFRVGQFLYLNVPAISKLQWHAFTIASSPRTRPTTVTVLLKSLGDWTKDLVVHANECKEKNVLPTVYVDGFYGASLEMYDEYSTVCLIGGGIGATPMFAILEDLAAKLENHETLQQKVVFIFSFRELALLEEVHPVLMRLKELDPHERYFKTHFYLTRPPSDEVLDRRIDVHRLQGKHIQPTSYEAPSKSTPIAFAEPARQRTRRALLLSAVVAVAVGLTTSLNYEGDMINHTVSVFWPLRQFMEAVTAILASTLVFACVILERVRRRTVESSREDLKEPLIPVGTRALTTFGIHTYRDLLYQYSVTYGQRPDIVALFKRVHAFHTDASSPTTRKHLVGVFVSGPAPMKRAVEHAAHAIDARDFDIHEEAFEL